MISDQVTDVEMQAARLFAGATMAGLLAAPLFRKSAPTIRIVLAVAYSVGVLGFTAYFLM